MCSRMHLYRIRHAKLKEDPISIQSLAPHTAFIQFLYIKIELHISVSVNNDGIFRRSIVNKQTGTGLNHFSISYIFSSAGKVFKWDCGETTWIILYLSVKTFDTILHCNSLICLTRKKTIFGFIIDSLSTSQLLFPFRKMCCVRKFVAIIIALYSFQILYSVDGMKVLGIFPHPGASHFRVFHSVMKGLAAAGHDVSVISHFPENEYISNYRNLQLSGLPILKDVVDMEVK